MTNSSIQITSGNFRGRKIIVPSIAHPMGSREKLALFNTLGLNIKNKSVLDIFAGSGALGIEALSRGAKHCIFVEKNRKAAKIISKNLQTLNLTDKAEVFPFSAEKFINLPDFKQIKFDYTLVDPPYQESQLFSAELLKALFAATNSGMVLSHPATFDPFCFGTEPFSTKKYAAACLSFYQKNTSD